MRSSDVEEVGLVDHRTGRHDEQGRGQVLADGGHHRALVQLDLRRDRGGPRQVLDLADRVRDEDGGFCVHVTHVVTEVRVVDLHARSAFKVHAVHQSLTAVFEQEADTRGAAVEFSVVDQQLRVVGPDTFADASNGGVVDDAEGTRVGLHTGVEAGDGGAAEGHRVAAGGNNTRGAGLVTTEQLGVLVDEVATVSHDGVGRHGDEVVGHVDRRPGAVLNEDTGRRNHRRAWAHRNVVAADDGSGHTALRRRVVGVEGDTAVAPAVGDVDGVGSSVRVGGQRLVGRVGAERVGAPRVLRAVGLGDLKGDFVAPAVGFDVDHEGRAVAGEVEGAAVAVAVVSGNLTQVRGGTNRLRGLGHQDARGGVDDHVVHDVTVSAVGVNASVGVAGSIHVVVAHFEALDVVQVNAVLGESADGVARDGQVLNGAVPCRDGRVKTARVVHHVVSDHGTLDARAWVEAHVRDFATVFEGVATDAHVVRSNLVGVVAPVVGRALHLDADRTIVERVVLDDVAVTAVEAHAHVLGLNGVVQRRPALVVGNGRVSHVEEVQLVVGVVPVADRTDDGCNAAELGVVRIQVHRVVQVSEVDASQLTVVVQGHALNRRVVHVDVDLAVVAWVHAREVVRGPGTGPDHRRAVPLVGVTVEVPVGRVDHDRLAGKVTAIDGAVVVAVLFEAVGELSARARRGPAVRTAVDVVVAGGRPGVAHAVVELVNEFDGLGVAAGVAQTDGFLDVTEVGVAVACGVPVVVHHGHRGHAVSVQVDVVQTGRVDVDRREGQVLSNTRGARRAGRGRGAFRIAEDNGDIGHTDRTVAVALVGGHGHVELTHAVELTRSGDVHTRAVHGSFDEVDHGRTADLEVVGGAAHRRIDEGEATASCKVETDVVAAEINGIVAQILGGAGAELHGCTGAVGHGTGEVTAEVLDVVHAGHGLGIQIHVLEVHASGSAVRHQDTVVATVHGDAIGAGHG